MHVSIEYINYNFLLDHIFDLILKSKVVSKEMNKCYEISYSFNLKGTEYIQTWKFDIRKKGDISFWFASEAEEVI
jgi:hypothetical protein